MNKWVDVKDRMPGFYASVLVWTSAEDYSVGFRCTGTDEWFLDRKDLKRNSTVKYWMPLPSRPTTSTVEDSQEVLDALDPAQEASEEPS